MPIYTIKLISKHDVAIDTTEFIFEKPADFRFIPGQYAGFTLTQLAPTVAGGATRRFSILSSPQDPELVITTRGSKSIYKETLFALKPGDAIKMAGPTGNFILPQDTTIPVVLIAGGIGITPFYSMLEDASQTNSNRSFILFYGNQTEDRSAYLNELYLLQNNHLNITFVPTLAEPAKDWRGEQGYITYTLLKKYLKELDQYQYFVCGSPAMVSTLQETLLEMEIPTEKIHVEDFPGY